MRNRAQAATICVVLLSILKEEGYEEVDAVGSAPGNARPGGHPGHSPGEPGVRAGGRERRSRSVVHRYQRGSNGNQCVGIQGVGNTGNAQNLTDVIQYGSEADDFEFEEVGSTITLSPESFTTCDQQGNQAASASG